MQRDPGPPPRRSRMRGRTPIASTPSIASPSMKLDPDRSSHVTVGRACGLELWALAREAVGRRTPSCISLLYIHRGHENRKVFKSGNSQAVRIPKQFHLDGEEVETCGRVTRCFSGPGRSPGRRWSTA